MYPPGPVALAFSPPFSLLATVSAAPFPLQTSHVPQLCLPVAQARHNVCYQQDIVSFYDSSLKFLILSQFSSVSLEVSDSTNAFGSLGVGL